MRMRQLTRLPLALVASAALVLGIAVPASAANPVVTSTLEVSGTSFTAHAFDEPTPSVTVTSNMTDVDIAVQVLEGGAWVTRDTTRTDSFFDATTRKSGVEYYFDNLDTTPLVRGPAPGVYQLRFVIEPGTKGTYNGYVDYTAAESPIVTLTMVRYETAIIGSTKTVKTKVGKFDKTRMLTIRDIGFTEVVTERRTAGKKKWKQMSFDMLSGDEGTRNSKYRVYFDTGQKSGTYFFRVRVTGTQNEAGAVSKPIKVVVKKK
jgi:hypothetical protein